MTVPLEADRTAVHLPVVFAAFAVGRQDIADADRLERRSSLGREWRRAPEGTAEARRVGGRKRKSGDFDARVDRREGRFGEGDADDALVRARQDPVFASPNGKDSPGDAPPSE